LQGSKLYLTGKVTGHPLLGERLIRTSMLIYISDDSQWARTLSRWYRLGSPLKIDISRTFPDIDLEGFCPTVGVHGLGIPLRIARKVMANRPGELSEVALKNGLYDAAKHLRSVQEHWPPKKISAQDIELY
jgi:hypothetical protein